MGQAGSVCKSGCLVESDDHEDGPEKQDVEAGEAEALPRTQSNTVQGVEVVDYGVSLAFLKDFCAEHIEEVVRQRCSTGRIDEMMIRPTLLEDLHIGKAHRPSYAELGRTRGDIDSQGRPSFDQATVFVAQSWHAPLFDLVEALDSWMEEGGADPDRTYFWLDLFSVPTGFGGWGMPESWWSDRYMKTIGSIGSTIVLAEPWTGPTTFVDPWAIWQFYCTTVTGARLHLAMGPEQRRSFMLTLTRSFEHIRTTLAETKVSLSVHEEVKTPRGGPTGSVSMGGRMNKPVSVEEERAKKLSKSMSRHHITDEIQRVVSFERLNEVLQTRLRHWLAQIAKDELHKMVASQHRDVKASKDAWRHLTPNELSLRDHVGQLLREMGNLGEGEAYFRKLKADCEIRLGVDSAFTLAVTNQLAVTLQRFRDPEKREEAGRLHRELLKKRQACDGQESESALQTASNLGVLLMKQWRAGGTGVLEEARAMTSLAFEGRKKSMGMEDPRTLYTATTHAVVLSASLAEGAATDNDVRRAEKLHDDAALGLVNVLGPGHPLTLRASQHRAEHLLNRAEYLRDKELCRQACQELVDILSQQTVKLGKEHDQTQETKELVHKARKSVANMENQEAAQNYQHQSSCIVHQNSISKETRPWREFQPEIFHQLNTPDHFVAVRRVLRDYGIDRLLVQLKELGFVGEDGMLTTTTKPFNVFARIGAGVMQQESMVEDQQLIGEYQDRFIVACNRPECDENWESMDPAWLGKASMAKHHRFLTMKDLHWKWFNVLVFGMVDDHLEESIALLESMSKAAELYVKAKSWPENVGFFFHVYSLSSVNSLHLHLVDLDHVGPTYHKMEHKNIRLADVLQVLRQEYAWRTTCS